MKQIWGIGRRKTSTARVMLVPGKGQVIINKKRGENYFGGILKLMQDLKSPLKLTKTSEKYDIKVNVNGGGITGQAGAIRLGISRALAQMSAANQKILRNDSNISKNSSSKKHSKLKQIFNSKKRKFYKNNK